MNNSELETLIRNILRETTLSPLHHECKETLFFRLLMKVCAAHQPFTLSTKCRLKPERHYQRLSSREELMPALPELAEESARKQG